MLRSAVHSYGSAGIRIEFESKFGGDHNLIAEGREGFAHQFFACERAVAFSGIEERNAALDRSPNDGNPVLLVHSRTVAMTQSHTAEPDG
jgi:hypothetical protein